MCLSELIIHTYEVSRQFLWRMYNFNRILNAISLDPRFLSPDDIEYLPKSHILNRFSPTELERVWDHLRPEIRRDPRVQEKLPCHQHYNNFDDHIDGPPTSILNCGACKKVRKNERRRTPTSSSSSSSCKIQH